MPNCATDCIDRFTEFTRNVQALSSKLSPHSSVTHPTVDSLLPSSCGSLPPCRPVQALRANPDVTSTATSSRFMLAFGPVECDQVGQAQHESNRYRQERKDHGEEAEEPCVDTRTRPDDDGHDDDRPGHREFPPGSGVGRPLGPTDAMLRTHV